jgi:molybdate transport repressor ModE-like protein
MMNFERLRALHAVAMHGSVNAAANALHVTTSAVSQQIAKLEDELGQILLEREGRGVRLSDSATALAEHMQRMLTLMEQAEADVDARRSGVVGEITVGAFPTALRGLAPSTLKTLRGKWPGLKVALMEIEPPEGMALLLRGELDLVIAQDWANAPLPQIKGLSKQGLLEDVADIAFPRNHRMAKRKVVGLDELRSEQWITLGQNTSISGKSPIPDTWCRDWLVYTLRSRGHEAKVVHTAGEHATQLALVAAGLGLSVIPRLGRSPIPNEVRIVAVKPTLCRHVYAVWRSANTRRRAIAETVEAFRLSSALIAKRAPRQAIKRSARI